MFNLNESIRRNELRQRRVVLLRRVQEIELSSMNQSQIQRSGPTMVQCIDELRQIDAELHKW